MTKIWNVFFLHELCVAIGQLWVSPQQLERQVKECLGKKGQVSHSHIKGNIYRITDSSKQCFESEDVRWKEPHCLEGDDALCVSAEIHAFALNALSIIGVGL